jgi:transposase
MSTHQGRFYELEDRETPRMFAPSMREAVADDPEVLGVDEAVEQMELWELEAHYSGVGHPAYPPKVMLKVLIYGYSLGMRASRMLERACKRDDAFRFLAHGLKPDHNSICRFRRRHAQQLPGLFVQTVELCQQAGLVSLGEVAVDGTKLRANRNPATLAKAKEQFKRALREAEQADGELPEEPDEAEFMKCAEGVKPAYNAQAAVDGQAQVIVAQEVDRAPNDRGHLSQMVAQTADACGAGPERVSADGSYYTREAVAQVEAAGSECYLPTPAPGQSHVEWVPEQGAYRCLMGHFLRPARVERGRMVYQWCGCARCPKKKACGVSGRSKRVYVWLADTPVGRLRARMNTAEGQAIYAARKRIVEPVFGHFKHNVGFRRLLLGGVTGARIEWVLMCMAHNVLKLVGAGFGCPHGTARSVLRLLLVLRSLWAPPRSLAELSSWPGIYSRLLLKAPHALKSGRAVPQLV